MESRLWLISDIGEVHFRPASHDLPGRDTGRDAGHAAPRPSAPFDFLGANPARQSGETVLPGVVHRRPQGWRDLFGTHREDGLALRLE